MAIVIEALGGRKATRERCVKLAYYCVNKMMPRKKNLDVTINLIPRLQETAEVAGDCIDTDDLNTFEINLDSSASERKILLTLAHEMVHVKQFTRRELEHSEFVHIAVWKGRRWCTHKTHYYDLPWEIEAHGMEVGLFDRWVIQDGVVGKFTKDLT